MQLGEQLDMDPMLKKKKWKGLDSPNRVRGEDHWRRAVTKRRPSLLGAGMDLQKRGKGKPNGLRPDNMSLA